MEMGFIHHDTYVLVPTYSRRPRVELVASYEHTAWVKGADPKGEGLGLHMCSEKVWGLNWDKGEVPEQYKVSLLVIIMSLQENLYY